MYRDGTERVSRIAATGATNPGSPWCSTGSPRPTSTPSANTLELSVENAVFLVDLLSHTIFGCPLVIPNLGPRRLAMADRSGPRVALIFGATLRMRAGQNNDQRDSKNIPVKIERMAGSYSSHNIIQDRREQLRSI
jgi:hypothetical protein